MFPFDDVIMPGNIVHTISVHKQLQCWLVQPYIDGLVQDFSISSALAMAILQSMTRYIP